MIHIIIETKSPCGRLQSRYFNHNVFYQEDIGVGLTQIIPSNQLQNGTRPKQVSARDIPEPRLLRETNAKDVSLQVIAVV